MNPERRDVPGALLAFGFVLLVTASEAALTLPDQNDTDQFVAAFYTHHRAVILVLQLAGLAAAALLAGYATRLFPIDRTVASTGLLVAALACAPGLGTIALALVADPARPATAGTWNDLLPRADDLLFLGIIAFGTATAVRLHRHPIPATTGALVALLCLTRLALEAAHHPAGISESLGPIAFITLIATLGTMSIRGLLAAPDITPVATS